MQVKDRQADLMTRTGCLLLIAAPLLVIAYTSATLGYPLTQMMLPHAEQDVAAQREGEILALTATFSGEGGDAIADEIDEALHTLLVDNWETDTLRAGRVKEMPTSEEEALALAGTYNAEIVVWGEVTGDELITHISLTNTFGEWEPTQQSYSLIPGDMFHQSHLVDFVHALMQMHSAPINIYRYEAASSIFYNLYHASPRTPFFTSLTAIYQIRCDLEAQDTISITQTLDTALKEHPNADLFLLMAEMAASKGDVEGVQAAMAQARALDMTIAIEDEMTARLLILSGKLEEALAMLDDLLAHDAVGATLVLERARLLDVMGRDEAADADYLAYLALAPMDASIHFEYIDRLIARQAWEEADAALQNAPREVDWNNPPEFSLEDRIATTQITLMMARGDSEGAEATCIAITNEPLKIAISGAILARSGNIREAEDIWQTGGFLNSPDELNQLAWLLVTNGWAVESESLARDAIAGNPDPNFRHTLGYALLRQGRPEEALAELEAAYFGGLMYGYPEIMLDLSEAHLALGNYEEAVTYITTFMEQDSYTTISQRGLIPFRLAEARYRLLNEG